MSLLTRIDTEMNNMISTLEQRSNSSHQISSENEASVVRLNSSGTNLNSSQRNSSLQFGDTDEYLITPENFSFSHLYNRDVRDIPISMENHLDFDRLRSCYILTISDLIGRYLIHRTPEEFRQFLIEKVRCSQTFTDEMMQLITGWTSHNLQIGRGTRSTILEQYL